MASLEDEWFQASTKELEAKKAYDAALLIVDASEAFLNAEDNIMKTHEQFKTTEEVRTWYMEASYKELLKAYKKEEEGKNPAKVAYVDAKNATAAAKEAIEAHNDDDDTPPTNQTPKRKRSSRSSSSSSSSSSAAAANKGTGGQGSPGSSSAKGKRGSAKAKK